MNLQWVSVILAVACAIFMAQALLRKGRVLRILQAQLEAYRRGDYKGMLKIIEGFRVKGSEPSYYLYFRGVAFFELGRLPEAESALRRSLSKETDAGQKLLCREQLGRTLMEQERWEDAAECFRNCIAVGLLRGGSHRALAELLLRSGRSPEEALTSARAALAADRARKPSSRALSREVHISSVSESLAVLAWALARNGGASTEVEAALKEAIALSETASKPVRSQVHFFAGEAYEALGRGEESGRLYQSAMEIDPWGNYGRLAESVWAAAHR